MKKLSIETREKMSKAKLGKPGYWLGKHHSEETKKKMSISKQGYTPFIAIEKSRIKNTGVKRSEEWKKKHLIVHKGENHYNWKGGVTTMKGYRAHIEKRREVRKLNNGGNHTLVQWIELKKKYNYMCLCCKLQEPEIKLTRDHIVPLSKGGSDNIENIQPLCQRCNSVKFNKIINYILLDYAIKS